MAGIMRKVEEPFGGGQKKEEQNKQGEQHHSAAAGDQHKLQGDQHCGGEHKPQPKEGIVDKIKDKIHGDKPAEEEKKIHDHDHGHDSGSCK